MSHLVTLSAADFKEEEIVKLRDRENQVRSTISRKLILMRLIVNLNLIPDYLISQI